MRRPAGPYAARLGLELDRVFAFSLAHSGLSASWDMDDGFDPAFRLKCLGLLGSIVP